LDRNCREITLKEEGLTALSTLVSAIFRQFGSCFGLFDIAG
jgi:hypothetical protein